MSNIMSNLKITTLPWGAAARRMARLAGWFAVFTVIVLVVVLVWGRPVAAQSKAPRATELQGVLAGQADRHFFGLESIQPGQAVALTLRFEAAALGAGKDVSFVVLSEDGLVRFLAGADPQDVAVATGAPPLFDTQDNRRTALVPGVQATGFTVIVYGSADRPMRYTLQVQGGLLRDDAGQSQSLVMVDDRMVNTAALSGSAAPKPAEIVRQAEIVNPADIAKAVPARRVTGVLAAHGDRHYLRLAPAKGDAGGEVTLTLQYVAHQPGQQGKLNVWVLTQEGVRQWQQGGLLQELNLAGGSPALALAGATVMHTTLRVAESVPYVVVVYNEMDDAANYTLHVEGAVVVDEFGQTNEAQAAVAELLALGQ